MRNVKTPLNWKIAHILIPLLPFLIGWLFKFSTIALSCNEDYSGFKAFFALALSSCDTLKFAFSTSIMAFFIKKDLLSDNRPLPNQTKQKEMVDISVVFFLYGLMGIMLFSLLFFIETRLKDCMVENLESIHIVVSLSVYIVGILTIIQGLRTQKKYRLDSKPAF